jgi:hypothetical protein
MALHRASQILTATAQCAVRRFSDATVLQLPRGPQRLPLNFTGIQLLFLFCFVGLLIVVSPNFQFSFELRASSLWCRCLFAPVGDRVEGFEVTDVSNHPEYGIVAYKVCGSCI